MSRTPRRHVHDDSFAGRLRQAKAASGKSADTIAKDAGVTVRVVQRWIAGDGQPSGENLIRLARVLDRDPAWFYDGDETKAVA